ncbi:MAG: type I-F CRISPR-associated protein Csy2 [Shewanella sp.]|nr:type I-F CRISPR-associated protein Csy2 [Shewanella sp.]
MNDVDFYLILERIQIQNANTISSPITYGFPALTGFLGAVHALQRKLPFKVKLNFDGALIACHDTKVKRFRPNRFNDYSFNQSRNPIKKDGKTASIIEEGKIDLTVSLIVPIICDDLDDVDWLSNNKKDFETWAGNALLQQRLAGGSVFGLNRAELISQETLDEQKTTLAPAFVLMDATSDLIEITETLKQQRPESTELDALIEVATLNHTPITDEKGKLEWKTSSVKQGRGWLVPMPVGFQGISPLFDAGEMLDSRSSEYPNQFVEALYGLGKWVFPYSIPSLKDAFWKMSTSDDDLYLIQQIKD